MQQIKQPNRPEANDIYINECKNEQKIFEKVEQNGEVHWSIFCNTTHKFPT